MQGYVIIRAFEGEPLRRVVVDAYEGRVLVAHPDSLVRLESGDTSPLSVPRSDVFEFDGDLFQRLVDEWNHLGETRAVTWKALRQWEGRVHA
jgi:hypothetical protein